MIEITRNRSSHSENPRTS